MLKTNDLEKNSVISRTTRGVNFKRAHGDQVKVFDKSKGQVVRSTQRAVTKQSELEEGEYFDRLELIIKRDFFPDLYKFEQQEREEEPQNEANRRMGLDEFLRRYTSEDNISFQELLEKDRQNFLKKISWMFDESAKYKKINQLAVDLGPHTARNQSNLLICQQSKDNQAINSQNTRTVPAIAFAKEREARSSLFFGPGLGN
mmetsp:Transcript_8416/g.14089  ORF Transcript_8416/g.14089 Transcript_8416/m.14089 type:complete len:202 (+) Transcript_8416:139-744(+)